MVEYKILEKHSSYELEKEVLKYAEQGWYCISGCTIVFKEEYVDVCVKLPVPIYSQTMAKE